MTGRMTGRRQPFPTGQTWNFIRLQLADAASQVVTTRRHETRKKCDSAAHSWIRWRIIRASGQVRQLEAVRINWNIPILREAKSRSGMIEMSVGEDDRLRWNSGAESCFGRFDDLVAPPGQPGVNENPGASGPPHEKNVYETDRHPADVRSYAGDGGHEEGTVKKLKELHRYNRDEVVLQPFVTLQSF